MIADSLKLGVGTARKLIAGVSPSEFSQFARVDGRMIESNHPAWAYGHLSLYAPRIINELGGDSSSLQISDSWIELFSAKSKCVDDPEGKIYPSMDQIVAKFFDGYRLAEQALREASDEAFAGPNPNTAMQSRFSTLGSMHGFYAGGHLMLHMGQVSAWRRMMGLGPA
ncbi:DinB family protein [Candidatus Laterigemmans baculatus]|nr:DinB family protein [Candidatus Laterigemmans baculatus]